MDMKAPPHQVSDTPPTFGVPSLITFPVRDGSLPQRWFFAMRFSLVGGNGDSGESARMGRSQARQHASRGDPELESALVDVTERLPGHARQTYPDGLIRSQSQRSPGVASSPYSKSREMLPQSESKMAHYAGQLGVLAEENQRLLKANVDLREELRRQQLETAKFKVCTFVHPLVVLLSQVASC